MIREANISLHETGQCFVGQSACLSLARLVRRFLSLLIALWLIAGIASSGLCAGSEPLDNRGRIPCDANGHITPSGLEALVSRPGYNS